MRGGSDAASGLMKPRYEKGVNDGGSFMGSGVMPALAVERFITRARRLVRACVPDPSTGPCLHQAQTLLIRHVRIREGTSSSCCATVASIAPWHTHQFADYALPEAHVNARPGDSGQKLPQRSEKFMKLVCERESERQMRGPLPRGIVGRAAYVRCTAPLCRGRACNHFRAI